MKENIKAIVAENLVDLRKSRNLTQADVAKALNYSDKSVSKWENADSLPDISILCALADMYGVTVDYLTHEKSEDRSAFIIEPDTSRADKKNRIVILLMEIMVLFLIATLIFSFTVIYSLKPMWQAFIWAVPASTVLVILYQRRWIKNKVFSAVLQSIFCWTLLTAIYLQFMGYLWLVFILGVPIQIIIILGANLHIK